MSTGLKFVAIAGGGAVIVGLGYVVWDKYTTYKERNAADYERKQKELERAEKERNKGFWQRLGDNIGDTVLKFTGLGSKWYNFLGRTTDKAGDVVGNVADNFIDLTTIVKYVVVGGAVLIGLLVIVFIGRMAMGNTPDPSASIVRVLDSPGFSKALDVAPMAVPQLRAAKMAGSMAGSMSGLM